MRYFPLLYVSRQVLETQCALYTYSTAQFAAAKFKCSVATVASGYHNGEHRPTALRR